VPRLSKIVVNIGVSEARDNVQMLDHAREELALISAVAAVRRATKSDLELQAARGHANRRARDAAAATACGSSSTG